MKKYYPPVRTLHLYFGLFVSPFILIFGLSVLVLNHLKTLKEIVPVQPLKEINTKLDRIPTDTPDLATAKSIIRKLGIDGEIDFIMRDEKHIAFPVTRPGLRTSIDVDLATRAVHIKQEKEGVLRATGYLHKMPGPHLVNIRGNSAFIQAWRWIADGIVYLLLFLSASGVFLWYFLKAERQVGLYTILAGCICFVLLLFVVL